MSSIKINNDIAVAVAVSVSVWNSLPDSVVSAESVNSFKLRLDKFWSMHEFVYDYRASPLAAGSV